MIYTTYFQIIQENVCGAGNKANKLQSGNNY